MSPICPLSDGFVCQITGFPPVWCLTIHLLYVQAASDCSLPTTEGNYREHLEQCDELSSVIQRTEKHHGLRRLLTFRPVPLGIQTSKLFLNPNAAPLCQLYASLLKDSAELFLSSRCCHCFIMSHRNFFPCCPICSSDPNKSENR